jgi:excisionase family DNA binding protein
MLAKRSHSENPLSGQGSNRGGSVETRERLLTPGEVANLFRVDPKTVTRWAAAGRIGSIRTPGGHRRFRESEVRALLTGEIVMADDATTEVPPAQRTAPDGAVDLTA